VCTCRCTSRVSTQISAGTSESISFDQTIPCVRAHAPSSNRLCPTPHGVPWPVEECACRLATADESRKPQPHCENAWPTMTPTNARVSNIKMQPLQLRTRRINGQRWLGAQGQAVRADSSSQRIQPTHPSRRGVRRPPCVRVATHGGATTPLRSTSRRGVRRPPCRRTSTGRQAHQ
jgi:hypothetical protein